MFQFKNFTAIAAVLTILAGAAALPAMHSEVASPNDSAVTGEPPVTDMGDGRYRIDSSPKNVFLEIKGPGGVVFFADPLTLQVTEVHIDAANPFVPPAEETVTINVAKVTHDAEEGTIAFVTGVGPTTGTNCTLQATYDPVTERWSFRCNPDAECPPGKSCTLLKDGEPVVVGNPNPPGPSEDPVVYECECR